jgi:hypothetical protein
MQEREPTRAELLERCKAAGLRATGWKKEKMTLELAKLAGHAVTSEDEGDEKPEMASAPDEPTKELQPGRASRSGWCHVRTPMWSRQHLDCRARARPSSVRCGCPCHADGWERPAVPAGAQTNRFNEEDA